MIDPQRSKTWAVYHHSDAAAAWLRYKRDQYDPTQSQLPWQCRAWPTAQDRMFNVKGISDMWNHDVSYAHNVSNIIAHALANPSYISAEPSPYLYVITALNAKGTRWLIWCPYE